MKLNPDIIGKKPFMIGFIGFLVCWLFTVQYVFAASLEVQVVDVNDNFVANLPIKLSPLDSEIELLSNTDTQGKCTFGSLENKLYALILQGFEHRYYNVEEHIEIMEDSNHYKLVVREKASLTIKIQYMDGSPAENHRVILVGESGAYKELFKNGQRTDFDGIIMYPFGVAEDQYTVIIKDKSGKEIARHSEFISSDIVNLLTYEVDKSSPIPSYPLLSVAFGLVYWIISRRPIQQHT